MIAQVCAIRLTNEVLFRGAVIVRNNRDRLYSTSAQVTVVNQTGTGEGTWVCPSSGVGAHSWSVCFGETRRQGIILGERARGYAGIWWLDWTPYV